MTEQNIKCFKPLAIHGPKLNILIVGYGALGKRKGKAYENAGSNVISVDPKQESEATYKMTFKAFIESHEPIFDRQHLVLISTNHTDVNEEVEFYCINKYKLYNRTDKSENSCFHDLSVEYKDDYFIAVGSGGKSPEIGRYVIDALRTQVKIDDIDIKNIIAKRKGG